MEIALALCVLIGALLAGGLLFIALVIGAVMALRGQSVKSPFSGQGIRSWINRGNLLASGTPARAILLSVASTGTRANFYGQRCEIRNAYVDIELPGVRPFEIRTSLYIPTNLVRDALPGSTMEVRIDPQDRSKLLVVGPDVGYTQGAVRTG